MQGLTRKCAKKKADHKINFSIRSAGVQKEEPSTGCMPRILRSIVYGARRRGFDKGIS